MSSISKLSRKGSFEDFYYTEIVDSSKTNAATILSMQFAQMRENLANAGFKATDEKAEVVLGSAGKGVKFDATTISLHESPLRKPASQAARSHVPSHVVPKGPIHEAPALLLSPAKTPVRYSVSPQIKMRLRSSSSEKVRVKRTPSPSPVKDMGVNPVVSLPERPEIIRTLGSLASTSREKDGSFATVNTFRGLKRVNSGSFHEEVHLHHDVFLATQDESIAQAVHSMSRRSQEVISRYADTPEVNYNLKPAIHNVKCTVPSHVVAPRAADRARSAPRGSSMRGGGSFVSSSVASPRSATPNMTTKHSMRKNTAEANPTENAPVANPPLTAKNLALNMSMCRPSSASALHVSTSKSSIELRVSPTTVDSLSLHSATEGAATPSRPVIKSPQKKKFDFVAASSALAAAPAAPAMDAPTAAPMTKIGSTANLSHLTKMASMQCVKSEFSVRAAEARRTSMGRISDVNTPLRDPTQPAHAALASNTTPAPVVTTDKSATPSPVKIYSPGTTKVAHYRTLTAAEHAAAAVLTAKLNAANATHSRDETVVVPPLRTMSRALSQLVYNVRDK